MASKKDTDTSRTIIAFPQTKAERTEVQNKAAFGDKIRAYRMERGLSQPQLAQLLGVTKNAITNWENGTRRPDLGHIPALCTHLGISADVFFDAEGQFDMSDIIFALKSRKTNLSMKLESCVKQADNGVCFYSKSPLALDMMELNADDLMKLITELQLTGSYDYIIVDTDFSIDREALKLYRKAHTLVWVGDGSELSNSKLSRAFTALKTAEADADSPLPNRTVLIYNKFSNRTSRILDVGIRNIGGSPRYEHATSAQILEALSAKDMFDAIM